MQQCAALSSFNVLILQKEMNDLIDVINVTVFNYSIIKQNHFSMGSIQMKHLLLFRLWPLVGQTLHPGFDQRAAPAGLGSNQEFSFVR